MKSQHSRMPGLSRARSDSGATLYHLLAHGAELKDAGFLAYLSDSSVTAFPYSGSDDDVIDFLEEDAEALNPKLALHPWKILIADDDSNVHETTLLALSGVRIHGRPLEFLHAYSAKQAQAMILEHPDIALVLLDVVMETVDAGLKLVSVIRNELKRDSLRIVLRTGQPGYAPEQQVNHEFAIDGYTTKSKLTRSILISVLNDTLANDRSAPRELPN